MKKNMGLETMGTMEETMKPWKPNRTKKNLLPIVIATIVSLIILISGIVTAEYGVPSSMSSVTSVEAEAAVQPKDKGVIKVEPQEKTTFSNVVSVNKTPDTDESDLKWHFFNQDIQDDGTAKNDYNFGPNPVMDDPEMVEKLKKMLSTKGIKDSISIEELVGEVSPETIDKNFRERMREDPALGAACMAWFDSILGTRYLGTFYSAAKEQWDVAMNDAKEEFMANPDKYDKTLKAFFKYLDSATKMEIKQQKSGLTDQMYMNPYTVDEVPDIVVMESVDHAGWFIVYHFTIKETAEKEVKYRLDCGYQPTNVAEIMKVKAKKNPNKKVIVSKPVTPVVGVTPIVPGAPVITGGGSGGHGGGGGGSTPTPTPTPIPPNPDPTPTPSKDPTKGTPVLPNDDPGPGEDTNGDPNWSSKDLPTNSNHMTHEEYHEAINENKEANEVSREAGEPNTPSTPPPSSDTHEDNNGDKGTGHGGIDKPTEKSESSVAHDSPGGHWDGPSD